MRRRLEPEFIESEVKGFFNFVNERHNIYLRRQAGKPWPWTQDKILQTYSFCNVFRELDTVTIWIRENFREPFADHKNLWFAMAMSRLINWHPTLAEIGFPKKWDAKRVEKIMLDREKKGEKVFTGAYIITAGRGGSKIKHIVRNVLDPMFKNSPKTLRPAKIPVSLEAVWDEMKMYHGVGPFIAYEIVTDMRHTRYLEHAPDIYTWANAGPGAKRGILRMCGVFVHRTKKTGNEEKRTADFLAKMQELLKLAPRYLPKSFPKLEMRDIEHCLCEYDKYSRVFYGEGRPRAKYSPPVERQLSLL